MASKYSIYINDSIRLVTSFEEEIQLSNYNNIYLQQELTNASSVLSPYVLSVVNSYGELYSIDILNLNPLIINGFRKVLPHESFGKINIKDFLLKYLNEYRIRYKNVDLRMTNPYIASMYLTTLCLVYLFLPETRNKLAFPAKHIRNLRTNKELINLDTYVKILLIKMEHTYSPKRCENIALTVSCKLYYNYE